MSRATGTRISRMTQSASMGCRWPMAHRRFQLPASLCSRLPPRALAGRDNSSSVADSCSNKTVSLGRRLAPMKSKDVPPLVMVADRDEMERAQLRAVLKLKGFRVIEAGDGPEAIKLA